MTNLKNVLVVSAFEKSKDFFVEALQTVSCQKIVTVQTCGEARRLLLDQSFELCILNAPMRDESGDSLAMHIAANYQSQVILLVKSDYYEEVMAEVGEYGVVTVQKPMTRATFLSALQVTKAFHNKLKLMQAKNNRLQQQIQDIRIVNRAKYILISLLSMSEEEAHKYIERQAMDTRTTKREIAENILKTYEN